MWYVDRTPYGYQKGWIYTPAQQVTHYMTWSHSFSLHGIQDPQLTNEVAGFEFLQSLLHLRSPGSLITDLWTKIPDSVLEAPNQKKDPHTSSKPMVLVILGCMSPQQNLRTRFRVPCQMVWIVGPKMCKRKDYPTEHPESKGPSGYLEDHLTRLDSIQVKIGNNSMTPFVSRYESVVQSTNTRSASSGQGDMVFWSRNSCCPLPHNLFPFPPQTPLRTPFLWRAFKAPQSYW